MLLPMSARLRAVCRTSRRFKVSVQYNCHDNTPLTTLSGPRKDQSPSGKEPFRDVVATQPDVSRYTALA
jgi:hypothetical protein